MIVHFAHTVLCLVNGHNRNVNAASTGKQAPGDSASLKRINTGWESIRRVGDYIELRRPGVPDETPVCVPMTNVVSWCGEFDKAPTKKKAPVKKAPSAGTANNRSAAHA